ncbi:MAG: sulfotransferase [Myxococcales bacterium]|nr:sulfotransferase [Myxococcales bacterium]
MLAPIRWLDRASRALLGRPTPRLGDALLHAFDAVGPLDPRWGTAEQLEVVRATLALYGRSIDQNPHVSAIGRFLLRTMGLGNLKVRAQFIDHYERNREFIEARGRVVRPLLVMGFPRTGTTLLHRLLSEDPGARAPLTFEMEQPLPPLRTGMDPMADPRIESSTANLQTLRKLAPGFIEKFSESHLWSATAPEELLTYVQFQQGTTLMNSFTAGRPYLRALFAPEMADALFKYERNFVTMLDAHCPARSHWTNKAPAYCAYFPRIFDHYPDANVVVTHRHPATNVASVCRLLESWLVPFDEDGSFDKIRHGTIVFEELKCWFERPLAYRAVHPERESQIADCLYTELMADPIAMVRGIYARFGLEYTQEFEGRMRAYLEDNKQGKYGRHKYSNAEYGLTPEQLQSALPGYYAKYGYGLHDG